MPDDRHAMTSGDVLERNKDLLDAAGALLAALPGPAVGAHPVARRRDAHPDAAGRGLDRVDVYVDGRPQSTSDVADGAGHHDGRGRCRGSVRIEGFAAGALVAARKSTRCG